MLYPLLSPHGRFRSATRKKRLVHYAHARTPRCTCANALRVARMRSAIAATRAFPLARNISEAYFLKASPLLYSAITSCSQDFRISELGICGIFWCPVKTLEFFGIFATTADAVLGYYYSPAVPLAKLRSIVRALVSETSDTLDTSDI